MKNKLSLILLLLIGLCYSQTTNLQISETELLKNIQFLDRSMKNNDEKIVNVLCSDVSFGHSNGWVQNIEDFKKDIQSKKIIYKNIDQIEVSEIKKQKNIYSVRRKIEVSGTYKSQDFKMILALLEIWKKEKSVWKLWSRQSVEIKP